MDIEKEFNYLYKHWRSETMFMSNPRDIYENIYFQNIIKLGLPALPYIVGKIQENGSDFTYMTIPEITGIPFDSVIPESIYGRIGLICETWVTELRKRNLI